MDNPMSSFGFKLMTFIFRVRDSIWPRKDLIKDAGIEPGFRVLDYGCGPGSYIVPVAQLVGIEGEIYALDVHPLALKEVEKIAAREAITNVKTIKSDCKTGLPDNHVDVVLLYDTFHNLSEPDDVLRELRRVLKPTGRLSFSDHHMNEKDIVTKVTSGDLFKFVEKTKKIYSFAKLE